MKDVRDSLQVIDNTVKKSIVRLIDGGWSVSESRKKEVTKDHDIEASFFGEDSFDVAVAYAKWKYGSNEIGYKEQKAQIKLHGEIISITRIAFQKLFRS